MAYQSTDGDFDHNQEEFDYDEIKQKQEDKSIQDLTPQSIIFKEAKEYKVKDSKIKYKRIPIETVYHNGNKGPLVIETPFLLELLKRKIKVQTS